MPPRVGCSTQGTVGGVCLAKPVGVLSVIEGPLPVGHNVVKPGRLNIGAVDGAPATWLHVFLKVMPSGLVDAPGFESGCPGVVWRSLSGMGESYPSPLFCACVRPSEVKVGVHRVGGV